MLRVLKKQKTSITLQGRKLASNNISNLNLTNMTYRISFVSKTISYSLSKLITMNEDKTSQ